MRAFFVFALLLSACSGPVDATLFLDNDGAEVHYVNGTEATATAGLQEEINGEFTQVWWSPAAACARRCGAPGGPVACALSIQAAEFGVVWAIQPGDTVEVELPDEPWVLANDAFGQCVRRTNLEGELRASLCHSDEYSSDVPIPTPTETGPIAEGFDNATWLENADCTGVDITREGSVVRASLGVAQAG